MIIFVGGGLYHLNCQSIWDVAGYNWNWYKRSPPHKIFLRWYYVQEMSAAVVNRVPCSSFTLTRKVASIAWCSILVGPCCFGLFYRLPKEWWLVIILNRLPYRYIVVVVTPWRFAWLLLCIFYCAMTLLRLRLVYLMLRHAFCSGSNWIKMAAVPTGLGSTTNFVLKLGAHGAISLSLHKPLFNSLNAFWQLAVHLKRLFFLNLSII